MADESWSRWALAAVAAVLVLALLAVVIGSLVPRGRGTVVGGTDIEQLETACKLVGGEEASLCQRMIRVDAAIGDGRCEAARVQARPILAEPEGVDLRGRLRAYIEARLDARCSEG